MKFLNYRGIRIRPYHLNLYRYYLLGMWSPALFASAAYGYFKLYPFVTKFSEKQSIDYAALLLPIGGLFLLLILPLFICLWGRRHSFLKGGFFYRAYQRQMLARMLKSNGLYDKKNENQTKEPQKR
jgi:hypothetical protein